MEPQTIRDIAAVLFPQGDGDGEPADLAGARSEDVTEFSVEEVSAAVSRFGSRCRAPGPDGIPSRVWSVVHAVSPGRLVGVFNLCLREGVFPGRWKRARLALLAKPGKPEGTPSSYRPLCLLDDVGKIFEFLLASRMNSHMSTTGVGLSEWQFGFRSGRCTDDALRTLRERLIAAVNARRYAAAVSLDIRNAFNTVGWGVVRAALVRMGFPAYVRRVLDSYLSERVLHVCDDHDGVPVTVGVTCGVPQGSVLGPLLWNVAFDTVFRLPLPAGATIIGYADDTLVVSEGNTLAALQDCANAALATVAGHIGDLGLRLAVDKTEAVVFKAQYGPADLRLRIGDQAVRVCESLKYLGIVHEAKGTWYGAHYRAAADKARRVMAALRGLMPNLGGPRESRRRLLTSVVHSVMLYGAPTWAPDLAYSRTGPKVLASVQRLAALSSVSANGKLAMLRQRAPKTAAVTIDRPAEGASLAAVMKKVAGTINLGALGVRVLTSRRTRAGGILLEVEGEEKAALLEGKIREVAGDTARVRRPQRKTPVLLLNIPEWAEAEDVVSGLAGAGIVVEAKSVSIRSNGGKRGDLDRVARVDLPFRDAIALAVAKAVEVGWTRCRVKLLEKRQSTCFRCQQKGHHAAECRSEAKPRSCFGCGSSDHLARECTRKGKQRSRGGAAGAAGAGAAGEGAKERSQAEGPSRSAGRPASPPSGASGPSS
ncbi:hypothetical protein QTP88_009971 [Uroleucon formosanum]